MSMTLHLVWGPTTTGKTAASVVLAEQTGAPVIALDRIQCCPELATGSGRPSLDELRGTHRIYIARQSLSDGIISAADANQRLKHRVVECALSHQQVILEGGSVSLLNEMTADPHWANFSWTFTCLRMPEPVTFLAHARQRVREMLHPTDGRPSLLDELAIAWHDVACRATLEDIDGYREAIALARRRQLSIPGLLHVESLLETELVDEIAMSYCRHARWQEQEFHPIPPTWQGRWHDPERKGSGLDRPAALEAAGEALRRVDAGAAVRAGHQHVDRAVERGGGARQ